VVNGIKVLTWNLERKKSMSSGGRRAIEQLLSMAPDVMVLTETRTSIDLGDGHVIHSEPPTGTIFAPDERKVLLWSKSAWSDVDAAGHPDLPSGRFVSAVTETSIGPIRFVGVCIPWHMADVKYGTADKRPWETHVRYLELLPQVLDQYIEPTVIAGDFNQFVPRIWGPKAAAEKLELAFAKFCVVTGHELAGCSRPGIDHIAIGTGLRSVREWGWPSKLDDVRCSDHDGAGCEIVLA
jgi:hypothetical protein